MSQIQVPSQAVLVKKPSGYLSSKYPLTVGKTYEIQGTMGPLFVISTDVPGETASIHPSHFGPKPSQ